MRELLKHFGVLYRFASDIRLAPLFDVVTTAIYTCTQYPGGPELADRTLPLKLFAGKHHSKAYPSHDELIDLGRRICGVSQPATLGKMGLVWEEGLLYGRYAIQVAR